MKKKKVVILSLSVILVLIISIILLVFNKSIFKMLRGDASQPAYEQAGFKSEEIYQCVIDAYNDEHPNDKKSLTNKLENEQLEDINNGVYCSLNIEQSGKTIDLQGLDKLKNIKGLKVKTGSDENLSYTLEKLVINNMTFDYDVTLDIETDYAEIIGNSFNNNVSISVDNNDEEVDDKKITCNNNIFNGNDNRISIDAHNIDISRNTFINLNPQYTWVSGYNIDITNNTFKTPDVLEIDIFPFDENVNNIYNLNIINNSGELTLGGSFEGENIDIDNLNITSNFFTRLEFYGIHIKNAVIDNNTIGSFGANNIEELNCANNNIVDISLGRRFPVDDETLGIKKAIIENNVFKSFWSYFIDNLTFAKNNVYSLIINNSTINNFDLSNSTSSKPISLNNIVFNHNFKYLLKGKEINIKDTINLPGETSYNTSHIIVINTNHILSANHEGHFTFDITNPILESALSFAGNVYDIKSDEYKIDKDKKTITIYEDNFDADKMYITDGYTAKKEDDNFIIRYGEDYVDTYKIVKEEKKVTTTTSSDKTTTKKDSNSSNIKNNNSKNAKQDTQKRVLYKDIKLNGNNVSSKYLNKIKGYNRNIVLKDNDITFKINGLDNIDIIEDIDLSYELIDIENFSDKESVKEVDKGYILKFNEEKTLPYKVLVEIPYDKIREKIKDHEIKVYSYKNNKYYLIGDGIDALNNKISYYIYEKGTYIITNDRIKDVDSVKTTTNINKKEVNNKTNIKNNNKTSKRLTIIIILTLLSTIIFITSFILKFKKKDPK